jgi:hypothetical protein
VAGTLPASVLVAPLLNGRVAALPASSKNAIEKLAAWLPVFTMKMPVVHVLARREVRQRAGVARRGGLHGLGQDTRRAWSEVGIAAVDWR